MSAAVSTSSNHKSTLLVIEKRTSIKTDGMTKLTIADNYQTLEMQVKYLVISINAEEILLENLPPSSDATTE
jgi:hypothetical protein